MRNFVFKNQKRAKRNSIWDQSMNRFLIIYQHQRVVRGSSKIKECYHRSRKYQMCRFYHDVLSYRLIYIFDLWSIHRTSFLVNIHTSMLDFLWIRSSIPNGFSIWNFFDDRALLFLYMFRVSSTYLFHGNTQRAVWQLFVVCHVL